MWRWENDDPFGANIASENPSGLGAFTFNLRLPGQYFDKETNYHYNYYRDYSQEIGRYIQSDPIGLRSGLNTYAYAYDDPLSFSDPMGLVPGAGPRTKPPPSILACGRQVATTVALQSLGLGLAGEGQDNTPWNAYLHCLWSCEMVKQCGSIASLLVGTGHELWDNGTVPYIKYPTASSFDLANNAKGRQCAGNLACVAGQPSSCQDCCLSNLKSGFLMHK